MFFLCKLLNTKKVRLVSGLSLSSIQNPYPLSASAPLVISESSFVMAA